MKLHYTPKKLLFDPEFLDVGKVKLMGCGRKQYLIVNDQNNLMAWGNVFKEKSESHSEGFAFYYGDSLFPGGIVQDLQVKYGIFGALVEE